MSSDNLKIGEMYIFFLIPQSFHIKIGLILWG